MGTRVPWLCPGTTFFQQINLNEFFFFAYITNQIASKKVKPRGTGSSDKKKIQKVIDKNVKWWVPGYPVVHIRVKTCCHVISYESTFCTESRMFKACSIILIHLEFMKSDTQFVSSDLENINNIFFLTFYT